jgi:hypothetical protein
MMGRLACPVVPDFVLSIHAFASYLRIPIERNLGAPSGSSYAIQTHCTPRLSRNAQRRKVAECPLTTVDDKARTIMK